MRAIDSLTQEPRFVEVFQNKASGWAIGYLNDTPFQDGDVCFTKDMVTWRPFAASCFAGSSVNHTVTCRDPEANDATVSLTKVGDTLWWNGNALERLEDPRSIRPTISSLPHIRKPEYLFLGANVAFWVYVSAAKYRYSYESFRFFIGEAGALDLREVPIRRVQRMRDGGSTVIETAEGRLCSPTRFKPELHPRWEVGGSTFELVQRNAAQFDITETENGVRICGWEPGKTAVQP